MKKILITGSSGFIGFHLSKVLLDKGFIVKGIDSMNAYYDVSLKEARNKILLGYSNFSFEHMNLSNINKTKEIVKNFNPDLVIFDTGVDIHENDKLGNLKITTEGLLKRDITVLEFFKNKSIPIATVIGGGYSNDKLELAKRHSLIFKATSMVFN